MRKPSKAAQELSALGAHKGGKARASVLTPGERSEIARRAVRARWEKAGKVYTDDPQSELAPEEPVPQEPSKPYSMFPGWLQIGDVTFECHVLNDGRRVLTQGQVVRALTGGRDSSNLGRYLARNPQYREGMLTGRTVQFRVPQNPQVATGFDAELLIEICDMYLNARAAGDLKRSQLKLAAMAEIIVRACAKVGIIALIDEATGYQRVREKRALQLKLQAFIAEEMQEWARMFPEEFWYELARLEGIHYSARHRPLRWGKYVMMFVYDAIDKDVGKALRDRNPNPRFLQNHHQWLQKFGRERVHDQIERVIAVMKSCDDMPEFKKRFAKVFRKSSLQLEFELDWSA